MTVARERQRNVKLAALIEEANWTHAQVAIAFGRVAYERGATEFASIGRSHVSKWIAGYTPSGLAPAILAEALTRQLRRTVTPDEIGLTASSTPPGIDWNADTLSTLVDLGRGTLDVERRSILRAAGYSVAALAVPGEAWWGQAPLTKASNAGSRIVGSGDLEAVRETVQLFTRIDQRRGGGHAKAAVVQYLASDVASYLNGTYTDETIRRGMFSTAGELAYLVGWMAFDNSEHAIAQRYFTVGAKLAAEARDPALAGHILRAMAHQAVDLGHHREAVHVAEASIAGSRYQEASPRERALLGVVHARALAADGQKSQAARALLRAEDDLRSATPDDDEPGRVFFFGEASLAHETACTLRDLGDVQGSIKEFRRSVRTRKAATFTRTHAVTLGYLGAVQAKSGAIDEACGTWSEALNVMDGIHSGRALQAVRDMRSGLSNYRAKGIRTVNELDQRAARYLATVAR
ncbi:hypothetical protein [Kribbella deserti]|uniref:Tat pathway signal protein n=1 Tax=Kribbella deserti TaxID=1926257 RepID=A0ABV6QDT0_9ACTN